MIDSKSEYHKVRQQTKKPYLMRKFGITLDTYNNMLAAQDNKCAICGIHKDMLDRPLGVDHNHYTLKVRGLLCNPCNVSFGLLRENTKIMKAMIAYADRYEGRNG
ncbi:unnamed protein product [Sphagnum balticum]